VAHSIKVHATAVQNDFKDLNFKDFIVASSYSFVRLHQPRGFSGKSPLRPHVNLPHRRTAGAMDRRSLI
jgi:hypothetical protein